MCCMPNASAELGKYMLIRSKSIQGNEGIDRVKYVSER